MCCHIIKIIADVIFSEFTSSFPHRWKNSVYFSKWDWSRK